MWLSVNNINNTIVYTLDNHAPSHSFESIMRSAKTYALQTTIFHLVDVRTYHTRTVEVKSQYIDEVFLDHYERAVYAGVMIRDLNTHQTHFYLYI